jgi:hypothetical protein
MRLAISVEGQTEERFIKQLVAPHLIAAGYMEVTPVIVATGRAANGAKAKGGDISLDRVTGELQRLVQSFTVVTSLYDFYGFSGRGNLPTPEALQQEIIDRLNAPRNLVPYIQRYEFEALLLSDAQVVGDYFGSREVERLVRNAVDEAGTPEDVNDSAATAPSKRLEAWTINCRRRQFSKKTKTLHGPDLATALTLPVIRKVCRRFDGWINALESRCAATRISLRTMSTRRGRGRYGRSGRRPSRPRSGCGHRG